MESVTSGPSDVELSRLCPEPMVKRGNSRKRNGGLSYRSVGSATLSYTFSDVGVRAPGGGPAPRDRRPSAHTAHKAYSARMVKSPKRSNRMRKNIYVRAEDVDIWQRAERLAGESISQLIADQLRRYVADREREATGFERIVVEAVVKGHVPPGPWDRGEVRKVSFYGRWLVGESVKRRQPVPGVYEKAVSDGDMHMYGIALTRRGKIAVLELDAAEGTEHGDPPYLKLYDSLQAADQDGVPHFILDQAARALNTDLVDELDI